jgi:prolyl-tRNA synthetase
MIMTHSDDDGLRLPPKIAPKHVVIIPVIPKPETQAAVFEYAEKIAEALRAQSFAGRPVEVVVDKRDIRGGDKSWEWIKKGIPVRIEVGPRDIDSQQVVLYRRDQGPREKSFLPMQEVVSGISATLQAIQDRYFEQAKAFLNENIRRDISTFEQLKAFFTPKNESKPEIHGGFVLAKWGGGSDALEKLSQLKVTVRCLPFEQSGSEGICIVSGRPAIKDAIFAKAY